MHKKLWFWSLTASMAGFLFGFDMIVISGADLQLQKLWPRGDTFHGFVIISSALWGTVLGAIFGNVPCNKWGRKKTLLLIGIIFSVSALGSAIAGNPWTFAWFRFIGGLGVGASTIAAPAYISEISPPENRGKLVGLYQFNIVLGILIAYLSNYLLSGISIDSWRWMLGVEFIPAVLYTLLVIRIPASPRWLIVYRNDIANAKAVSKVLAPDNPDQLIDHIVASKNTVQKKESIFLQKYRRPLLLVFLIAFFNQFSGINALLYYAPRIFETAGLASRTALLSGVGIGVVNLVFTWIGLLWIDRYGRKQLMYIGSVGYILSLFSIGTAFLLGFTGAFIPVLLFIFIASHAIGQGAVIWVFISEVFPNHLRASGQAFGSGTHWILAALIPSMIPLLFGTIGPAPVFYLFGFMMILQLIFVWRLMPETKGISLEKIENITS